MTDPADPVYANWMAGAKDPLKFVTNVLGATPEPWQAEALGHLGNGSKRLAIRSGHGIGKTTFESWAILWWLFTRTPSGILVTANSQDQLRDTVMRTIGQWVRAMPDTMSNLVEITAQRMWLKPLPESNWLTARTASRENPEALQGLHEKNMLVVLEEASAIPEEVIELGQGILSTEGSVVVMVGNPTRTSGYFYDAFHSQRDRWTTMHVSSEDVPRARGHIDDIVSRYGRDSNAFRVRVSGEFPVSDDDVVIPLHLMEAAIDRPVVSLEGYKVTWGVDPARFGSDASCLCKRRGNQILEPVKRWRNRDVMQLAGVLQSEYEDTPEDLRPHVICIDSIGLGAGVYDAARHLGLPVRAVNVSERPANRRQYQLLRDELYFRMREWFEGQACVMPDDADLISELSDVKYAILPTGKTKVESKADIKKRIGRSPDKADALMMTFGAGLDLLGEETYDRYDDMRSRRRRRRQGASSAWAA
jgi:phage terminase large subunit